MPITIIAIGKKHDSLLVGAIEQYEKRVKKPYDITWEILPHSSLENDRAREQESAKIKQRIKHEDMVILLDERGNQLTSPELASHLHDALSQSKRIVFIIGGAYGVTQQLRDRANTVLSVSSLVFPHQLMRLLLIEQIYRCYTISNSIAYHNR